MIAPLVGLDVGTSAVKAIAVAQDGEVIARVLEGVACGLRDSLDLVAALGARPDARGVWRGDARWGGGRRVRRRRGGGCGLRALTQRRGARPRVVEPYRELRERYRALYPALPRGFPMRHLERVARVIG